MAEARAPAGRPRRGAAPARNWRPYRLIPLALAAVALLAGLWTGMGRLGLLLPGGIPALA